MSFRSLSAHITHYPSPGRLDFLTRCIDSISNIGIKTDIFVHTSTDLNIELPNASVVIHDLNDEHPHFLAWKHRDLMRRQVGMYDAYMYLEDDIQFGQINFDLWKKHQHRCSEEKCYLGFIRVETDGYKWMCTDVTPYFGNYPLKRIRNIDGIEFVINDCNPYCGFWISSAKEFGWFAEHEYFPPDRCPFYGNDTREKVACGPSPLYECVVVLPEEEGSFVHHMPNNYIGHQVFCKVDREELRNINKRRSGNV